MTIKNGETADADDVVKNIITYLESMTQTTALAEAATITDLAYDYAQVDVISDTTGYNNTIDTGNSDATFDTDHYKAAATTEYVQTETQIIGTNCTAILVTAVITLPGVSTITFDVSSDGGSTWDATTQSLNTMVELDGDSDDIVIKFNMTVDGANLPLLYSYAYQVWT